MSAPAVADMMASLGLARLGESAPPDAIAATVERVREHRRQDGTDPTQDAVLGQAVRAAWRKAGVDRPAELWDATSPPRAERDDERQGRAVVLSDPDPWPEPVEGAALLDELTRTYARYLAQPDGAVTAEALWTVHAHAHDAAPVSPLLVLTSAAKRCGKTTALTLAGALVARPLPAANITAAALFRAVEAYRPTLLVDEADAFIQAREELRGVLNSGHTRSGAVVVRTVGDDHEVRTFSTWCPKAVALIGRLHDTLTDRSIHIAMRRRRTDERVERLRLDRLGELEPLRRRAARWAADHLEELRAADPDVPPELHDRAADNWRPLLAIADLAGGPWPERARRAALLLSGAVEDDGDVEVLLLADLRRVLDGRERIASADAVRALVALGPDRPWSEWRRGQPITERQLARLLAPYGVRPRQLWDPTTGKLRGYSCEDLADVWARYCPPSDPVDPVESSNGAGSGPESESVGAAYATGSRAAPEPNNDANLPLLPDRDPPPGPRGPDDEYQRLEREAIQREGER